VVPHVAAREAHQRSLKFSYFSRLVGTDEEGTLARLKTVRKALVDPTIAAHRGRIVKTTGDGMLVEFAVLSPSPGSERPWQVLGAVTKGTCVNIARLPVIGGMQCRATKTHFPSLVSKR
jgi:class 3 adenylate cyclase